MKADLHVHTCYSNDGKTTLEELVEYAVEHGIGCVAITDHNSFEAYEKVKDNGKVIIIPAEEVSSKEGHIVALGIDRLIPRDLGIQETIDLIHEAGGYAFAAHPYRWWSGIGEKNTRDYPFDGVEARNGRSVPSANRRSQRLADSIGKPQSAGSDAHTPRHIGEGYVILPDTVRDWREALQCIMGGVCEAHSSSRGYKGTIKYGTKSIFEWIFRGFKKM
ncbi:MAG: PHP domain-containing protein [Candidatus Methanomethylophilaceae archaeon]|nr:PHP domain-containing protein [Candidatus Methanomethylophilaceae archaeon]